MGSPAISPEKLDTLIQTCYANNIQVFMHVNADPAIDMLIDAHRKAVKKLHLENKDLRTVAIHSQSIREDQLDNYKELN